MAKRTLAPNGGEDFSDLNDLLKQIQANRENSKPERRWFRYGFSLFRAKGGDVRSATMISLSQEELTRLQDSGSDLEWSDGRVWDELPGEG